MTHLFLFFGAGAIGALVETLLSWGLADAGAFRLIHSVYRLPEGTPALYMRMVWGGIYAMAMFFPSTKKMSWLQCAALLMLAPSVAQLLYFMPQSGAGWFGSELGWGTPIIVLAFNLIWAAFTAYFSKRGSR